jgi:hypothetical protein
MTQLTERVDNGTAADASDNRPQRVSDMPHLRLVAGQIGIEPFLLDVLFV